MNDWLRSKTISTPYFYCIVLLVSVFFLYRYWHDPQIDFAPLYTAGHIWKSIGSTGYYGFEIEKEGSGFILHSTFEFSSYAKEIGFDHRVQVPVFLYFPAFIPLFSLCTIVPYGAMAKIIILLSCLTIFLIVRTVIDYQKRPYAILLFTGVTLLLLVSPVMHWAIKTGQITPLLTGGTLLVVSLLRKRLLAAAGLFLSVLTWIKLFPAFFVLVFLLRKDYRAVVWFILGCISIFLFGTGLFGIKVIGQYVSILGAMTSGINICWVNQSFEAFFQRYHVDMNLANRFLMMSADADVILFAVLSKILILLLALRFVQLSWKEQSEECFLFVTYALMGLMVLLVPVSWVHYYVFFIPLAIVVGRAIFSGKMQANILWISCYGISLFSIFIGCGILTIVAQLVVNIFGPSVGSDILKMLMGLHLIGGVFLLILAYGVLRHPSKPFIA
jgi:hypothetical protein